MLYTCLLLKFTEFVDARSALAPAPLPEGEGITLSVRKRTLPLNLLIGTFFAVACASPIAAHAHEIRPAVVTAVVGEAALTVAISANFEAMLAGIGSAHRDTDDSPNANIYNALRALPPSGLEAAIRRDIGAASARIQTSFDGRPVTLVLQSVAVRDEIDARLARLTTVTLTAPLPAAAREFEFSWPAGYGACFLKARRAGDTAFQSQWLSAGGAAKPISLIGTSAPASRAETMIRYLKLGFTHILPKGLDHILFVLGLFLLSPRLKPLLIQVSAFTLAHSITLALAMYGVIRLSPAIVEPLIAASIAYVAVENVLTPRLHAWRTLVVFGFGLLHGLGFAGVLTGLGLPREEFVSALIAFNVGVEFGQLTVIALAFLAVGAWFRQRDWYRSRVTVPASLAIACIGAYWTVQRAFA